MTSIMTVYAPGQIAIGHVQDFGPRRVLARAVNDAGRLISHGFFEDRRAAREAVQEAWRVQNPRPP